MTKRIFDFAISFVTLVFLSPVFLVVSLCMKMEDGGPVFYRGVRVGRFGREFRIFKFRSMVVDAEARGGSSTASDDLRITRFGRILRKFKFDEIPQLLNVLRGEMSLVGPRPQVPHDVALYTEEESQILSVRPGVTDYASVRFHDEGEILRGSADPDKAYAELIRPEKLRLSLKYVRERSFWVDLKILWMTLKTLFSTRARLNRGDEKV